MPGTGRTVGTVGGAAIGSAIAPGVGTIIGGALGGVVGGLFDSDSAPAPQITGIGYGGVVGDRNHSDLKFGQSEADRIRNESNARAAGYGYAGNTALARSQVLGDNARNAANLGQQNAANQQLRANALQVGAIGSADQYGGLSAEERGSQYDALGRLQNFYGQGPGPSAAEAQMRAGADANMAQSIALARSGRGAGGNAAAMRQAQFGNAAAGQQLNQQLGVLRANEAANWRQQQLGAMGLEQNTLAGMRGQDIGAQGQALGFAGQMGSQGLGYGQLGAQYQNLGNQATLGYEHEGNQTNLGFNQLGNQSTEFGETLRNKIFNDTSNLNMEAQIANANLTAGHQALEQKQDAANQAFLGSALSGAATMMGSQYGAHGTSSDERGKKNIHLVSSPVEAKRDIRAVGTESAPADYQQQWGGVSLREALFPPEERAPSMSDKPIVPGRGVDLRPAGGYAYEYKEPDAPGAVPGQQVGPMAHEVAKTSAANTVKTDPRTGMDAIDTNRLSLVNTSAIGQEQRRVDRLEKIIDELAKDRPDFNLGALDAAYGRQTADTGARWR